MRKAIIDSDGKTVNIIEVSQAALDAGEWTPPAGHTLADVPDNNPSGGAAEAEDLPVDPFADAG